MSPIPLPLDQKELLNNIHVLKYKGDDVWGGFIYDNLLELNEFLEKNHIESIETDLGEYIVQLLGQKPYHIVTPAMHLSKEDIAKLFHEKFGTPIDATPTELTLKARELLREKYFIK